MAELLRSGHTMLNLACPICNNPVFKNKAEELFCAICNREVILVENEDPQNKDSKSQKIVDHKEKIVSIELKEVINDKINFFLQKLKNESQVDLIEKYLNLLLKCFKILDKERNL